MKNTAINGGEQRGMTYTHHIPTCEQGFQWAPLPPLAVLEGGPRTERRKVEMTPLEDKGGSESNSQAH